MRNTLEKKAPGFALLLVTIGGFCLPSTAVLAQKNTNIIAASADESKATGQINAEKSVSALALLPGLQLDSAQLIAQSSTRAVNPAAALAQTAALTPASALTLATDYDARYLAAKAQFKAESESVAIARAGLRPSVGVNANRNYNELHPSSTRNQNYFSSNTGVSVRQPLYRPESTANLRQAEAEVGRQEALLGAEKNRLVFDVAGAYFELLRLNADYKAQFVQQQSLNRLVDAALRALPLGLVSASMVQDRRAKAAQGELRVLQALARRSDGLVQLERLIGQPVRQLAGLADTDFVWLTQTKDSLASWQDRAKAASPEVQAAQAATRVANETLSRAGAGAYPTLDLVLGRNRSVSDTFTTLNTAYINNSIGLQLAVPLYDGGRSSAATRQAAAQLERAQAQLLVAERDLDAQVSSAYQLLTQADGRLAAHQAVVASALDALNSARQGQLRGQQSALDVLEAQGQLEAARLEQLSTQLQLLLARLRLNALAGDATWLSLAPLQAWLGPSVAVTP
jgi:TolC family type I secretion outer membrane protein